MNDLEQIIRTYVALGDLTKSGWCPVRCLVCNDHAHKIRGGFKFEGSQVSYHCFNCPAIGTYDPTKGKLSDAMRDILESFGIPKDELSKIVLNDFRVEKTRKSHEVKDDPILNPKELELPSYFTRLIVNPNNNIADLAEKHLQIERGMSLNDYTFYTGIYDGSKESKSWMARLIIPFYFGGKIIYYQGRELLENSNRLKYLSCSVSKTNIVYGMDEIYRKTDDPLYVAEGFFDVFHLNGIATLGNELSAAQIKILNRTPRKKVFLPDRKGDGHLLALDALKHGWAVSMPEIGDCKDICEAIVKYGKLYVMQSIIDKTYTGFRAETEVRMLCEKTKRKGKKVVK